MKRYPPLPATDPWNERPGESRRTRSPHVPGGFYYVIKHGGHTGRPIFGDAFEYATFEKLLALALARFRCRLHGFCWESDAIHLALQVSDRPIGRFLQWLCSWYSRGVSTHAVDEVAFERSYRAVLVEPGQGLLRLIRYLHLRPVSMGIVKDPADSALTSHRAYMGCVRIPWLTTSVGLRMLAPELEESRVEYRWMMRQLDLAAPVAGVERYRRVRREVFDLPAVAGRSVESLQIRAVPVPSEKWS